MYPRQCAEPVDHASRAARRLNAVAISLSLSHVYAGAQSAQWHFPGLRVLRPSGISSTGAKVRSQSTGQLLRTYCLSVRQQRCNSIKLWKPTHDRRTGPKPNPAGFQHFCRMSCLCKELDQPCSTIEVNRLTGDPPRSVVETVEMWESRRDSQRAWEGWLSRHHGPPCFPYSVISMVCFSSGNAG